VEPSKPGRREEVYCTKIGTTHPEEMYVVGGHMDGIGWGEGANDDAEMFDIFDYANFGNPNLVATPESTTFGVIQSTRFPTGESGSSRQVQFTLKVMF
jgi:hypothetical protein